MEEEPQRLSTSRKRVKANNPTTIGHPVSEVEEIAEEEGIDGSVTETTTINLTQCKRWERPRS